MANPEEPRSELALAIEANKPKAYPFEVHGIFGLGRRPIRKVSIHAPRKGEDEAALKDAHVRVDHFADGVDSLKGDEDLLNDAKAMAIIQRAVRSEDNSLEVFGGVDWMKKHFTGDQVGQLINLITEVRVKEAGIQWDMSLDRLDSIIQLCVRASATDIPERVLSAYQREYLSSLVCLMALRIYRLERPGVEVKRDPDTGKMMIAYPEGQGPEWEKLPEGWLEDPELDEGVADAVAEDHERID